MSKNITLNGNTYSGVSVIQIGTARFIEESESVSWQTFIIDQEYSDPSVHGIQWLLETYFGTLGDGTYIAKTLNNTGFANSAKEPYALKYFTLVKYANKYCGRMIKTNGDQLTVSSLSDGTVVYLAQGATLKTMKILEESV